MPLNPIPMDSSSFKSSVGSKSTNLHQRGTAASGSDGDLLVGCHQERRQALRSFWISRLQLQHSDFPLPTDTPEPPRPSRRSSQMLRERLDSESAGARDRGAISTDESRSPTTVTNPASAFAARRYLYMMEERRAGARTPQSLLPPPRMRYDGGGERRQPVGFGPFQVRAMNAIRDEEEKAPGKPHCGPSPAARGADGQWGPNFGFGHGRKLELFDDVEKIDQRNDPHRMKGVNLSLFFRHQPPADASYSRERDKGAIGHQMDEGCPKVFDNWTHRWTSGDDKGHLPSSIPYFSSQKTVGEAAPRPHERRVSFGPWHANASVQTGARSRATDCCDVGRDDAPSSTSFSAHHFQHGSMTKRGKHLPNKKNEPDEQFSFWNLGKFNKGNVISSASPTTTSWNLNRKRNANTEGYFQPSKFRKM